MTNQPPCAVLPVPIKIPRTTSTTQNATLDYYGPVEPSLAAEAAKFLAPIISATESEILSTAKAFLSATQNDCVGTADEKKACWLTIRATKPTDAFEEPRWHQDGRMYPYDEGREDVVRSKYGLTLLGPTTLMLQPDDKVYATQREGEEKYYLWDENDGPEPTDEEMDEADSNLRTWLAREFKDAPRVRVGHGEVIRFSWGRDDSPVHSEPDLVCDRVFMTVLYGSESELRGMCEWRNAEYGKYSLE